MAGVLPKLLAAVAISGPVILVSGVVTSLIGIGFEVRATLSVAVALLLGVAAYSAIFTWTGLVTSRALAVALLYVVLWVGVRESFGRYAAVVRQRWDIILVQSVRYLIRVPACQGVNDPCSWKIFNVVR